MNDIGDCDAAVAQCRRRWAATRSCASGVGGVDLATHPRLPRQDALKILPVDVSAEPDLRERFKYKADLASTLFHPHIIGVHDRGEFKDNVHLKWTSSMGRVTSRLMRERHPTGLPVVHVIQIVQAVAEALDYAHGRGMLAEDARGPRRAGRTQRRMPLTT
jgi:serine/threonine protein kinase, bacterial